MYSVALVQNQSEMAHYSYADARPLLDGYTLRLFTGDNIKDLSPLVATRQVDALLVATNALNDKDILAALCNDEFAEGVGQFLASGRGVLGLQQLGLAMRRGPTMRLLPGALGHVRPAVLDRADDALRSGTLAIGQGASDHVALTYPELVDPEQVRSHACAFSGLPGLYWHYWDEVDVAEWDQLIVDPHGQEVRPLVLAAKESRAGRVVLSALPLDWQKHVAVFHNLLMFVVEGRHRVATVDVGDRAEPFDYLRETMRAQHIPFGEYVLPDDRADLIRNVEREVHATVLLGTELSDRMLSEPVMRTLERAVDRGKLRIINVGPEVFGTRTMTVLSRERRPHRLLQATELQLQSELRSGYIDDSFWSHVETLQTLEHMPDRVVDYGRLQEAAFAITRNHDRNGSYDEVFGATCAYYWLRARYLGVDSAEARQTATWLRRELPSHQPHERVLAYLELAGLGQLRAAESEDLHAIAEELEPDRASETELLLYLRALLAADECHERLVASLASALVARQRDGIWVDLTTTASTATALLEAHHALARAGGHDVVREQIEVAAGAAVVFILRALARSEASPEPHPYPWDGKARTTTKCVQAWLLFEALQDLPVYELLENLGRADRASTGSVANRTALGVLQAISEENSRLRVTVEAQRREVDGAERQLGRMTMERWAAAVALYLLGATCLGLLAESDGQLGGALTTAFVSAWSFHFGVVGLLFTAGVLNSFRRRRERTGESLDTAARRDTG
jgi:hypothetical protein